MSVQLHSFPSYTHDSPSLWPFIANSVHLKSVRLEGLTHYYYFVVSDQSTITLKKRYSDFFMLYTLLRLTEPELMRIAPSMPPKTLYKYSQDTIRIRKTKLLSIMQFLMYHPVLKSNKHVQAFFN